jgi:hypothetical protein
MMFLSPQRRMKHPSAFFRPVLHVSRLLLPRRVQIRFLVVVPIRLLVLRLGLVVVVEVVDNLVEMDALQNGTLGRRQGLRRRWR